MPVARALLTAEGIVRRLDDAERRFELRVPSIAIGPGDRVAIVGPSGCGKTTALDVLALASAPDAAAGFVLALDGGPTIDILDLFARGDDGALAGIRARHFGYVLQTHALMPFLTVQENIEVSMRLAGRHEPGRAAELLRALDLDVPLRARPAALSVGQRQRVAVARALAHRPHFLVADEPTASLDPASAERTLRACLALVDRSDAGMLLVTHDRALAEANGFTILEANIERRPGTVISTLAGRQPGTPKLQVAR
jgi:putative ABC transport system ATP-binding protein